MGRSERVVLTERHVKRMLQLCDLIDQVEPQYRGNFTRQIRAMVTSKEERDKWITSDVIRKPSRKAGGGRARGPILLGPSTLATAPSVVRRTARRLARMLSG